MSETHEQETVAEPMEVQPVPETAETPDFQPETVDPVPETVEPALDQAATQTEEISPEQPVPAPVPESVAQDVPPPGAEAPPPEPQMNFRLVGAGVHPFNADIPDGRCTVCGAAEWWCKDPANPCIPRESASLTE